MFVLFAALHLGDFCVVFFGIVSVNMTVSGIWRCIYGAFAFLKSARGYLGGICTNLAFLSLLTKREGWWFRCCRLDIGQWYIVTLVIL